MEVRVYKKGHNDCKDKVFFKVNNSFYIVNGQFLASELLPFRDEFDKHAINKSIIDDDSNIEPDKYFWNIKNLFRRGEFFVLKDEKDKEIVFSISQMKALALVAGVNFD